MMFSSEEVCKAPYVILIHRYFKRSYERM